MNSAPKVYESHLYEIWKSQQFIKPLQTTSGLDITVLDPGVRDPDVSGPDFKHARIRIGNITYVGDIEIDGDYSNWKSHGHNINNKYDKIVLHVALFNKFNHQYVYTKEGRKVPTLSLCDFINNDLLEKFETKIQKISNSPNSKLKCSSLIEAIDEKTKSKYLLEMGMLRFDKKCSRIYQRLKELTFIRELKLSEPVISYDLNDRFNERKFTHDDFKDQELWLQLFYEFIFEALGYSKNKTIMMNLAQSVNIEFLKKLGSDGQLFQRFESALFTIGGLIPDVKKMPESETTNYTKELSAHWENICKIYDGKTYDETQWHFFKMRPQNFPTIRIAGGVKIIYSLLYGGLLPNIIKKINEIRNLTVLINSLRSLFVIKASGFWQKHYVFDQPASSEIKYFVGASRADEIIVNVILPFMSVYFNVFGNSDLSKKVLKLYNIYPQNSDNKIVRDVGEGLNLEEYLNKTIYSQGMIELFRSKCSKNKCLECEIGKVVFG
ncbi:MAG: DUF2851 family protein [Bacteroidetes bacterium]|nr:DUF2851 family protein [Bacteroidota bacterium]